MKENSQKIKLLKLMELLQQETDELHSLRHLLVYRHDIKNYVSFGAVQGVNLSACNIEALTRIQKLTLIKVNSKIIEGLGELKRSLKSS